LSNSHFFSSTTTLQFATELFYHSPLDPKMNLICD
jgi:hypothetical protein